MHQFYSNGQLLFVLENAAEYDTASPYRYAVSRFVQLAERIKKGQSIRVVSGSNQEREIVLDTVDQLLNWIAEQFTGFDHFVQEGMA